MFGQVTDSRRPAMHAAHLIAELSDDSFIIVAQLQDEGRSGIPRSLRRSP
jgi:hypothetical protein